MRRRPTSLAIGVALTLCAAVAASPPQSPEPAGLLWHFAAGG